MGAGLRDALRGAPPPRAHKNSPTEHHIGLFTARSAEIALPYYFTGMREFRRSGLGLQTETTKSIHLYRWAQLHIQTDNSYTLVYTTGNIHL